MANEKPTGPLRRLRQTALARTVSLAKMTVGVGARAAGHAVGSALGRGEDQGGRDGRHLASQLAAISREIGQLKGSVMKAGQMLSMVGEHFLPPEANAWLKSLQSSSPPMAWEVIAERLAAELPAERLAALDVDPTPLAAASLGQVHRAVERTSGRQLVLKVQYPGVAEAIGADLKSLRTLLKLGRLLPRGPDYDSMFLEVKHMLEQETDYLQEQHQTATFRRRLADDPGLVVPEVLPAYSSGRVLCTTFEAGLALDSPEVRALSQPRRNALGAAALGLYMRELWELGRVQTDAHFGNYRVRLDPAGQRDQLVLLDFGATREVTAAYLAGYRELVLGAVERRPERIVAGAQALGFLAPGDSALREDLFCRVCQLICEPFAEPSWPGVRADLFLPDGSYDWGRSDLPRRVAKTAAEILLNLSWRMPPREAIFLDRKLGGVFIILSTLGVQLRGRDILARYLPVAAACPGPEKTPTPRS